MNEWNALKTAPPLEVIKEDRKNEVFKQRADIRELAFDVLTADSNRRWIKSQVDDISDIEELKEVVMVLVDHYHEQIKRHGAMIVELLNK